MSRRRFSGFSAQLNFDPAKLAKASARIEVDVASIDTGSTEADAEVVGKAWFDAKRFPKVSFVSTGIRALGGNRYEASGKLSIKGKTRDVVTPVTFQSSGNKGIFEGSFTIRRLDYGIGEGMWADVSAVADQREVRDVRKIDVAIDRASTLTFMFDPEHALDDRITMDEISRIRL